MKTNKFCLGESRRVSESVHRTGMFDVKEFLERKNALRREDCPNITRLGR